MVGKYVAPSKMKKLEKQQTTMLEALKCPSCSAPVSIRAAGVTTTLTCASCSSLLDLQVSETKHKTSLVTIENKTDAAVRYKPAIPLGSRAKFHGTTWEVIGFVVREEYISPKALAKAKAESYNEWFSGDAAPHEWREYLLFSPYKGYRWLTEDMGHWNYFVPLHEQPQKKSLLWSFEFSHNYVYSGLTYSPISEEVSEVQYVQGEFYWRVRRGDKVKVAEYLHRPYLITREKDKDEVNWSFGEYLYPEQVREAFKDSENFTHIERNIGDSIGVGVNEPIPLNAGDWSVYKIAAGLVAAFFAVNLLTSVLYPKEVVYESSLEIKRGLVATQTVKETFSKEFTITSTYGGLEFLLKVPKLNNNWLSLDVDLINEVSGETVSFEIGAEYYSGFDDGVWTEGSRVSSVQLPSVPKGKYILFTSASMGVNNSNISDVGTTYEIKLFQNSKDYKSMLLIFVLLMIFPVILLGIAIYYRYAESLLKWMIWTILIVGFILLEFL